MRTPIRPARFALGLAAAIFIAPLALVLVLVIYTAVVGGPLQCDGAAMQNLAACRP